MSLLQLKQNPYMTPATFGGLQRGGAMPNPYLTPGVPELRRSGAIANPRGLLVVKARKPKRVNPFRLPGGLVGKTCENALGAGAAFAVNAAITQFVPAKWWVNAPGLARWGITALSPYIAGYFPRLGPAFGGAMYFSVLNPLYENAVKKGIMAAVREAIA